MILLQVNKNQVRVVKTEPMTSGSQNVYACQFQFSEEWDYLQRVAVFATDVGYDGPIPNEVYNQYLDDTNKCFVPWEVNKMPYKSVYIGVFGTMNGEVVLPTVWADIGSVLLGVTTGIEIEPPTPTLWEQILNRIGHLETQIGSIEAGSALPVYQNLSIENASDLGESYPKNAILLDTTIVAPNFSWYLDNQVVYLQKNEALTRDGENQNGSSIDIANTYNLAYRFYYDETGTFTNAELIKRASDNGEPGSDGKDGISPTIQLTPIENGTRVTVTDINGEQSFDVMNGADGKDGKDGTDGKDGDKGDKGDNGSDGADGFSPIIEVTEIDGGHRVTITDETGPQSFDVLNGKDGSSTETLTIDSTLEKKEGILGVTVPVRGMTQAEAEALPDEEKNRGMILLTDTEGSGNEDSGPIEYTKDEVVIGIWVDGKPLYRAMIELSMPSSINKYVKNSTIDPIDTLVRYWGYLKIPDQASGFTNEIETLPFAWHALSGGSLFVRVCSVNGSPYLGAFGDLTTYDKWAASKAFIVLEYTKTTD